MKAKVTSIILILLLSVLIVPGLASAALPLINNSRITDTILNSAAKLNPAATPKAATTTPVETLEYDGTQSKWAEKELIEAFQFGLTYDDIENNFQKPITREEFCTIAVKLYEKLSNEKPVAVSTPFIDTNNQEIAKAFGLSIVKGTGANTFSPDANITRQEICVMIRNTLTAIKPGIDKDISGSFSFNDTSEIASWALDCFSHLAMSQS